MMLRTRTIVATVGLLLICTAAIGATYKWTDPDGSYHATDRLEQVPPQYQEVLKYDVNSYTAPNGVGFERDRKGTVQFFDHSSPARQAVKRDPPPSMDGPPGSPVSAAQLLEMQRRYQASGVDPRPEVVDARVKRIITGDTFELDNGQKVTFIGIEFPNELKGETPIHKEAIEFQRKLMEGKTVHLLFGPQRYDDKGRLLAFVFIGTDVFVNAELVMNGYARVNTVPPNTEYRKLFLRLENFAKQSMLGMWNRGN